MKISELIQSLQAQKEQHGDADVMFYEARENWYAHVEQTTWIDTPEQGEKLDDLVKDFVEIGF
jgi:hypothetical protein